MKIPTRLFKRSDWKLTSKYGFRIHPVTKLPSFHSGIDYGTNREYWAIYGLEKGIVTASGINATDGNYVWVEYPRIDLKLFHGHLLNRSVFKGDKVDENTILGKVGKSGRADGIHLHLGVRNISNGKNFDFENYEYTAEGEVSGIWDEGFTKLLQILYRTFIDGIISRQIKEKVTENIRKITYGIGGSNLIKAIQRESGYLKVDGYLGKNTILYLQKKYGVKLTGYIEQSDELIVAIKEDCGLLK